MTQYTESRAPASQPASLASTLAASDGDISARAGSISASVLKVQFKFSQLLVNPFLKRILRSLGGGRSQLRGVMINEKGDTKWKLGTNKRNKLCCGPDCWDCSGICN